jgi:hypothetical protein
VIATAFVQYLHLARDYDEHVRRELGFCDDERAWHGELARKLRSEARENCIMDAVEEMALAQHRDGCLHRAAVGHGANATRSGTS